MKEEMIKKPERIVMLYRGLNLGGIETLIVRFANYLISQGCLVTIAAPIGPLLELLDEKVDYIELECNMNHSLVRKKINERISQKSSVLFLSFDPFSRFLTDYILQSTKAYGEATKVTHLSGCFHPRAYFHEVENRLHHFTNSVMAQVLGNTWIYFMNDSCRENHLFVLGLQQHEGRIIHLPTQISECPWVERQDKRTLRIIAIGRIVKFKAYNFGLLDFAENFVNHGVRLEINIYGHGDQVRDLEREILHRGLSSAVKFSGSLEYRMFESEVKKNDLFVGMGTAALEAAGIGIPTIFALDGERNLCLGFTHELPSGAVGERVSGHINRNLEDCINEYLMLNSKQRTILGGVGRDFVSRNSNSKFLSELTELAVSSPPYQKSAKKYFFLVIYFKLIQSIPDLLRKYHP